MNTEPVLNELLSYFCPLATNEQMLLGWPYLLTPEVNILALNAVYLGRPEKVTALLAAHSQWQPLSQSPEDALPLLVASTFVVAGQEVGAVRVGTFAASKRAASNWESGTPGKIVVEQVSRLHLSLWTSVLAEAYETPEWTETIAQHLAAKLEGDRRSALLLAYLGGEVVGALLWRETAAGGAAHLWGTLEPQADEALLSAAAELSGGTVRVSLPDQSPLTLTDEQVVIFTLLEASANAHSP